MVGVESRKSMRGECTSNSEKAVFSVRVISTSPESFDHLYGYLTTFVETKERRMPGFLEAQVLGSDDKMRIIIIVEWKHHEDWVHSEWDAELGVVLEELMCDAQTVDFHLYSRDRFIPAAK